MQDRERVEDLERWIRTLAGHLSVSPIKPRKRSEPVRQPRGESSIGDTDVDDMMPHRTHLRDLNLALASVLGHVRALYLDRGAFQPAPLSRIDPARLPVLVGPPPRAGDTRDEPTEPRIPLPGAVDPRPTPCPPDLDADLRPTPAPVDARPRLPEIPPVLIVVALGVVGGLSVCALLVPVFLARALFGF